MYYFKNAIGKTESLTELPISVSFIIFFIGFIFVFSLFSGIKGKYQQ